MTATIDITQDQEFGAVGGFLTSILVIPAFQGQVNRVPETTSTDFAEMWPISRERLDTNTVTTEDCLFFGSISAKVLTIGQVVRGTVAVGRQLFGDGVSDGTLITGTGTGGTFLVNNSKNMSGGYLSAGARLDQVSMRVTMQVDVHGLNSSDNVQIVNSLFRSEVATDQMEGTGITPLYCSDPRQIPFINAEQQVEQRWSIDLVMEVNPTVTTAQQFMDAVEVGIVSADVNYPAA